MSDDGRALGKLGAQVRALQRLWDLVPAEGSIGTGALREALAPHMSYTALTCALTYLEAQRVLERVYEAEETRWRRRGGG